MKISKRQFLKYSFCGFSGLCLSPVFSFNGAEFAVKQTNNSKFEKEAMYYTQTAKGLKCLVCPSECDVKPNAESDCRTRINRDGKLISIAYGNPCVANIDPIEKKPLYHYLPQTTSYSIATAGCNLACLNCQNWTISQTSPLKTRNLDLMPAAVVEQAKVNQCKSISYTYSEPIVYYEYTHDTAKIARQQGIKNVLVSAGYIHEEPLKNLCKYIDAANIDLKSFDNAIYLKLNGVSLQPILNTLKIIKQEGVWLEITNLVIPTWTDNLDMIKKMCDWLFQNGLSDNPLHFSRFNPLYKLTQLPSTPVETLEKARQIALNAGLKYVYIGNVPGSEGQNTYCPKCKKIVVERKGFRMMQNHIKNNKCEYCSQVISGLWS